ncbi:MAG: toll/interleukin-1 receptor domain-containing protein [Magnetospirillum sp.]|nr:toll/interleukin-1 receptor domain-containing protein [Magnetospirillum sp.]
MTDADKSKNQEKSEVLSSTPLVFISHDSRDADFAEAFSKLLKSVSAGMIKTFRSSDKKGGDGIDFGEEWYKRIMSALQSTSDVICLFTERSVDRPWILFEAGVAKGKLSTPVIGVALGIPLDRVSAGPFYQFQNMDDSEADLTKLINQLSKRVPGLELDADVVKTQVTMFKNTEAEILKKIGTSAGAKEKLDIPGENSIAKIVEEMKALPSRVTERLLESDERILSRRRARRLHPMMFDEIFHMSSKIGDPVAILLAASVVRDDAPWLYELAMEVYRAIKSGEPSNIKKEISRIERLSETLFRSPFIEELTGGDVENHILFREFPRMLHRTLARMTDIQKPHIRRKFSTQEEHNRESLD